MALLEQAFELLILCLECLVFFVHVFYAFSAFVQRTIIQKIRKSVEKYRNDKLGSKSLLFFGLSEVVSLNLVGAEVDVQDPIEAQILLLDASLVMVLLLMGACIVEVAHLILSLSVVHSGQLAAVKSTVVSTLSAGERELVVL